MNRRIVTTALVLASTACFAGSAYAASGPHTALTVSTTSAKAKLVSFHLRNDSGSALTLQVGEQQITVDAGKTVDIKAENGLQIVAVNASGRVTAGAVVATVSSALNGNTVAVN